MKKVIYSALAVAAAIAGVAGTKANVTNHRALATFIYIGPLPATAHAVTTTANWTLLSTAPAPTQNCSSVNNYPCEIIAQVNTTASKKPAKVPNTAPSALGGTARKAAADGSFVTIARVKANPVY